MTECTICITEFEKKDKVVRLDCGHKFHLDCVIKLKSASCPNCRHQIEMTDLCYGNHKTMFYSSYYTKDGVCRICCKKSFKYHMLKKLI